MALCAVIVLATSGCTIALGTYEATFVDYKGNLLGYKTFQSNVAVDRSNVHFSPHREGHDLQGWYVGEDVEGTKAGTKTYWPLYKLIDESGTWEESGRRVDWYGRQFDGKPVLSTVYLVANQMKSILVCDRSGNDSFSALTWIKEDGSLPDILSYEVYDTGGRNLHRNSHLIIDVTNSWQVQSYPQTEVSFVLEVVVAETGYYTLQVY